MIKKWTLQSLAILCLFLIQGTISFASDWKIIDEFSPGKWTIESWPMSENSRFEQDISRHLEGKSSWKTSVQGQGWGGGFRLTGLPPQPVPTNSISVSVFMVPGPSAQGTPSCKLEARSATDQQPFSGGEIPLTAGKWTKVNLPASAITAPWNDLLIVVGNNNSTGTFNLWFDDLKVDQLVIESFDDSDPGSETWNCTSLTGTVKMEGISTNGKTGDDLGLQLTWTGTKKAELKKAFKKPFNISCHTRWRLTMKDQTSTPSRVVGLWLYDGERGSWLGPALVEKKEDWTSLEYDITAAANDVDLSHIQEIAITVQDETKPQGTMQLSHLETLHIYTQ